MSQEVLKHKTLNLFSERFEDSGDMQPQNRIERLLQELLEEVLNLSKEISRLKNNTWMEIPEAADYIKLSTRTVYRLIEKKNIPYKVVPNTNKIRFKKRHLDIWLETGKNPVSDNIPTRLIKEINKLDASWPG